eukprot:6353266-Heterocapsa_arctica.AAC.1
MKPSEIARYCCHHRAAQKHASPRHDPILASQTWGRNMQRDTPNHQQPLTKVADTGCNECSQTIVLRLVVRLRRLVNWLLVV